ncbi:MAG: hypothetical protein V1912_04045 [bacterium]
MGLLDKLTAGAERAAKEAEKAFDKGKTKVGELQIEMQMDGQAKKLGYLVFDFYRGREVDQALRQKILDDLSRLEDQLFQTRDEAAAKAQARTAASAQGAEPAAAPGEAQATAETAENSVDGQTAGDAAQTAADALKGDEVAPPTPS